MCCLSFFFIPFYLHFHLEQALDLSSSIRSLVIMEIKCLFQMEFKCSFLNPSLIIDFRYLSKYPLNAIASDKDVMERNYSGYAHLSRD